MALLDNAWYVNAMMGTANGSWTTANSTITMLTSPPAGWTNNSQTVWDITLGLAIGTVSSWSGTTLTLTGNATHNSSGSTDQLGFSGYYSVTPWVTLGGPYTCGALIRQAAAGLAVGNERVFVCYNSTAGAGVSGVSEPTWVITRGGLVTDGTVKWAEATGIAALNGDVTNTPTWTQYRTLGATATLGQVIQNNAKTLLLLCTVGGTMAALGSEPSWSAYTATGATTNDGTTPAVWVTLGAYNKYSIWNSPHARLANSFAANWGATGNSFFVSSIHGETQATSITETSPGIVANPCFVYCVKNAPAATPPGSADLATTAMIACTGNTILTLNGAWYGNGFTFAAGTGGNPTQLVLSGTWQKFENCALQKLGTSAANYAIQLYAGKTELVNTTMQFGSTGDSFRFDQTASWKNTASAIVGATLPTALINTAGGSGSLFMQGIDLSALGSGKTLWTGGSAAAPSQTILLDCSFGASITIASTPTVSGTGLDVIRSDSSGTNYQQQRYWYEGSLIPETTIVRTGGAQVTGTGVSWNVTTTAHSLWVNPFETPIIAIQNSSTSPMTATIYGIWKTAALPNNDQIWVEAEYLGNGSYPLGSFATSTKANNLASGSPVSADTSAWGAGAAAYQTSHAYGAFTGVILAGNASPQQLWFMASHSGTGTSGGSSTIFNGQADGAQVTDNSGANQIVWQAMTRFALTTASFTPALATTTFYVDPQPVL